MNTLDGQPKRRASFGSSGVGEKRFALSWRDVDDRLGDVGRFVLVAAMSPGPDFVLVVRNALTSGKRIGVFTALGIGVGVLVWAVSAAIGVAALLAASATLFSVVKICGAIYLVYLGVRALRSAASRSMGGLVRGPSAALGRRSAFVQGFVTNLLNPKAAVFFVALLPQFLPNEATLVSVVELCLVTATVTASWFTVLAIGVDILRGPLARPKIRRSSTLSLARSS